MSVFKDILGTIFSSFQLGFKGIKLKNIFGDFLSINKDNDSLAGLMCSGILNYGDTRNSPSTVQDLTASSTIDNTNYTNIVVSSTQDISLTGTPLIQGLNGSEINIFNVGDFNINIPISSSFIPANNREANIGSKKWLKLINFNSVWYEKVLPGRVLGASLNSDGTSGILPAPLKLSSASSFSGHYQMFGNNGLWRRTKLFKASTTTIYIDTVNGVDSESYDGSFSYKFKTIAFAIHWVTRNIETPYSITFLLSPGTYTGSIYSQLPEFDLGTSFDLTVANLVNLTQIRFSPLDTEPITINCTNNFFGLFNCASVIFDRIIFSSTINFDSSPVLYAVTLVNSQNVEFKNCVFQDIYGGIRVKNNSAISIKDCTFRSNIWHPIKAERGAKVELNGLNTVEITKGAILLWAEYHCLVMVYTSFKSGSYIPSNMMKYHLNFLSVSSGISNINALTTGSVGASSNGSIAN